MVKVQWEECQAGRCLWLCRNTRASEPMEMAAIALRVLVQGERSQSEKEQNVPTPDLGGIIHDALYSDKPCLC